MVSVVFMVAGMSSRFGGKPKQMAKVGPNNETLIEYSVNQALTQSFNKLIFITNHKTEHLFHSIFGNNYKNIPVLYIQQKYDTNLRNKPWGTTDAICSMIGYINESFIMLNGDDIYGTSTFEKGFHIMINQKNNVIGGLPVVNTIANNNVVNRGIIYVENDSVVGLKEMLKISKNTHPELMSELANVNFIGLDYKSLLMINNILLKFKEKHKNDPNIECLLPDVLNELILEKKINMDYFEITENIIGLTHPEDETVVRKIICSGKVL